MCKRIAVFPAFVTFSVITVTGCGGQTARSARMPESPTSLAAATTGANSNQTSFALPHPSSSRRHSAHEAFLSTYRNPEHGVSFRYPRNYVLQESSEEESPELGLPFLKLQEQLDEEQPGATLLATMLIPDDAYPNTTFERGSLQLVVNEAGTQEACGEAATSTSTWRGVQTLNVHGIVLRGSEQQTDADGTKSQQRVYTGFAEGTCYEFFLSVLAEEAADPDGYKKAADLAKIMNQLQEIVKSTQIFPEKASPATETSEATARRL
jgi:hypothetical protein